MGKKKYGKRERKLRRAWRMDCASLSPVLMYGFAYEIYFCNGDLKENAMYGVKFYSFFFS